MAKIKSMQKQIGKVRPPRVQITYDVEVGNEIKQKTLPFVVGVLADLGVGGTPEQVRLRDRIFTEVNEGSFDKVMAAMSPSLTMLVPNRLGDEREELRVSLTFKEMDDFTPEGIAGAVPQITRLMEARVKLNDLLAKLEGNERLNDLLVEVVNDAEVQAKVHSEIERREHSGDDALDSSA